ncbi:MAG: acyltransferase [Alistipes sp.]|jgi:surface polysaccharide O-acyltransferase-like enzyme|nr:acyltransferase [Alistipes sp.]
MTIQPQKRIIWLDVLRLVALLMVIAGHSVDMYNATPQDDPMNGFWGAFIGSLMRPSVPLFAMMTGLLLLPVRESAGDFYRRRIPRVLVPMVIWSAIYYLVPWLTGVLGMDLSVVSILYPFEFSPSQDFGDALHNIAMIPFAFNGYTTHMWYIYMLIGLYLIMPFFSAWIEKNDRTLVRTFIIMWCCSLMLPYLSQILSPDLFGRCAWNEFGTFYYFAGFAGYLLLGHLLGKGNPLPSRKIIAMGAMLYFAGYIITYTGFSSMIVQYSYEQEPELIEMFWQFCSPNVALMAIGMFLAAQRVKIHSERVQRALANITKCGFGIYLMHYILLGPIILLLLPLGLPTPVCVIVTVILVFLLCWGVVNAMYKLLPRVARYIVG